MITSTRNPRLQVIKKLLENPAARRESGAFVIEGIRLVEEACQAGWLPQEVYFSEGVGRRGQELLKECQQAGVAIEQVSPDVMRSVSDTQTPQGLLAVVASRPVILPGLADFILILDALRDPGNVGAILRTAAAAGVQAVLLTPGSADPYGPKVLRAAMGAHFRLPVQSLDWDAIRSILHPPSGPAIHVYLADVRKGEAYTLANFRSPLALLIGGEAEGAGQEARLLTDALVHIPMPGGFESLNAAAAAAILIFEVIRQRTT
jgi:TrmH family RNA methyltransferase